VSAGATASGTMVAAGGTEWVFGSAVSGGIVGVAYVFSGGVASGEAVSNGALIVLSGGTASGTVLSRGGDEVLYGGASATGTVVSSGGTEKIYAGGSATGDIASSGCTVLVTSGGTLNGATLSGGLIDIQSGGMVGTGPLNFTTGGTGGGTLQLDDSVHFHGVISGFGVPGGIDLRDIAFGSGTTLGFTEAGDNLSGTLTVSDGTNTANITLLGQYVAGNFTKQSDGNGGTLITDPPIPESFLLTGSPWRG